MKTFPFTKKEKAICERHAKVHTAQYRHPLVREAFKLLKPFSGVIICGIKNGILELSIPLIKKRSQLTAGELALEKRLKSLDQFERDSRKALKKDKRRVG